MAQILLSPGTLARENDSSQVTSGPIQAGAALVGPTVKGKVNIPTVVTTYSEYLSKFGSTFTSGSDTYTFLTSIAANNYFQNGGDSLLVTRVQTGSFTPATSTTISALLHADSSSFVLETLGEGTGMNSSSSLSSTGVLDSGSDDNLRWEIASPNTSSGVFSVLIRKGNDTAKAKSVLETFTNVSLDPKSPNYVARIIGNQVVKQRGSGTDVYLQTTGSYPNGSRYVRVKSVTLKTPDYLDNGGIAKAQYTQSIPIVQSGSFNSATGEIAPANATYYENISNTNTQGLTGANYEMAFNLLANKDEFQFNSIAAPGLIHENGDHATSLNILISNIENRGDALIPLDLVGYASTITVVTTKAASVDSSYAASYWPWLQTIDPDSQNLVWVPASTLMLGVYSYSDKAGEPWFAPAGMSRGGMSSVTQAERKLTQPNRDTLYVGKVNPIGTFPGKGVVVFGQKTLQTNKSATDRVNVRKLLIELKSYISQIGDTLVFEGNTVALRNSFLADVNPYLDNVQQRRGLYAYQVVMDDSNNTSDLIDRNQLLGSIWLKPTKTAEFVYLDFNILPTGTLFPS